MYTHAQHGQLTQEEVKRLRKEAGAYLKDLRKAADLTQNALATNVGFDYYTMVSQIENGKVRLPPERLLAYAHAVGVSPKDLAWNTLKYYDPMTYEALTREHGTS